MEQMTNQVPAPIDSLLGQIIQQIHSHTSTFTVETLIGLVPQLNSEDNYYNLGMVLHHLLNRCPYREFKEILDDNKISRRMAGYLIAIYVKFNSLKIPCPMDVHWRTLGEGVGIINALNYKEIIQFCREKSAKEVRKYIRSRKY